MPSAYIKNLSKELGKSEKEIEKLWDKAKKIASEDFGKKESEFTDDNWAYVTGIVKNMLGLKEATNIDHLTYLHSKEMNIKNYIELLTSSQVVGDANLDMITNKPDDEDDDKKKKKKDKD